MYKSFSLNYKNIGLLTGSQVGYRAKTKMMQGEGVIKKGSELVDILVMPWKQSS